MRRRLFNFAVEVSLVLCLATAALWVRGVGRSEGWYFKPSPTDAFQAPDDFAPSTWYVQWQINWGDSGVLIIQRQFKTLPQQPRIGFYTRVVAARRWNPLPQMRSISVPTIEARLPDGRVIRAQRTKRAIAWSHFGITYASREREVVKFPTLENYFTSDGAWSVGIPLTYLFILFAILPGVWAIRFYRTRRTPEGHCISCGYNLAGNTSGVCPECGTAVARTGAE